MATLRNVCRAIAAAAALQASPTADDGVVPAGPLDVFTSSIIPNCTLEHYAAYLAKSVHQPDAVVLGAVLLIRVWRTSGAAPTPKTVHRLLLGCVSVAMKAHYDDFYLTSYVARTGSVSAAELGLLEARVGELLEWSLQVRARELAIVTEELTQLGANPSAAAGRCVEHFVHSYTRPPSNFSPYDPNQIRSPSSSIAGGARSTSRSGLGHITLDLPMVYLEEDEVASSSAARGGAGAAPSHSTTNPRLTSFSESLVSANSSATGVAPPANAQNPISSASAMYAAAAPAAGGSSSIFPTVSHAAPRQPIG